MGGLKKTVLIANFGASSHAHAADQTTAQIRQDIAEHVLHYHDIEIPRAPHQIERLGIDVVIVRLDVGVVRSDLVENLAEESHRCENIGLVDTCHATGLSALFAFLSQFKREIMKLLRGRAGNAKGVAHLGVTDHFAAFMGSGGIEQPLGGLTQDNHIDLGGARVRQTLRRVGIGLDRANASVKAKAVAQA